MKIIKKILVLNILLLFIFINNVLSKNIILQKNNIIITKADIINYKKLFKDFNGLGIIDSVAIKKLYMTFKIVDLQILRNPNFIQGTNSIIKNDVEKHKDRYTQDILEYFFRYELLKKDFINNYITKNNFNILDGVFKNNINIYNDKNCKLKKLSIKFDNLNKIEKIKLIENLSIKEILIENNKYICLKENNIKEIKNALNNIVGKDGYEKFLEYVYKNIK